MTTSTNGKPTQIFYEEGKVILTPFSEREMTDRYRSWFHDSDVTRYNAHGLFPYTTGKMEAFKRAIQEGSDTMIVMAIYYEQDGVDWVTFNDGTRNFTRKVDVSPSPWLHIGNIALQSINYINRSAELAWVIGDKSFWGKGIATVAGNAMLSHAVNRLNMHRVWTGVAEGNVAMQRVCEKIGLTLEGRFTDGVYLNGTYSDIVLYSAVKVVSKIKAPLVFDFGPTASKETLETYKREFDANGRQFYRTPFGPRYVDETSQEELNKISDAVQDFEAAKASLPNDATDKNYIKKTSYADVLRRIEDVRKNNNTLWMDLARLAFANAEEEAKTIFAKIVGNDSKIVELSKELLND